jgi:preprotein translocase subunit SecF
MANQQAANQAQKQTTIYPFMQWRKLAAGISLFLVLLSLWSLATRQLALGLDFTGGTQIEVVYQQEVALDDIRATLEEAGYQNAVVVNFGSDRDILVRLPQGFSDEAGAALVETLRQGSGADVTLRRIEFVGPQVGEELREQGGLALLLALGVVMAYVAVRFQYKFSVGAVVALAHDVIITLGVFSWLQLDFDLTVMAALLAVIGYSLNDTIVVSDRIRENFRKLRKTDPVALIDISLTETLGRTLVTSFTTVLVLGALFFFGGEMIHNFATALLIGVLVGTYSSIYVAANILLAMGICREDLVLPPKEEQEIDGRP